MDTSIPLGNTATERCIKAQAFEPRTKIPKRKAFLWLFNVRLRQERKRGISQTGEMGDGVEEPALQVIVLVSSVPC